MHDFKHELRKDPLMGRWVAVLGVSMRPDEYPPMADGKEGICPLCEAGAGGEVSVVKGEPILLEAGELGRKGAGIYDTMNPVGVYEIIIESGEHAMAPEEMGPEHFRRIFETYQKRFAALAKDPRIRYVFVYKNKGKAVGARVSHPHSELMATPVIPEAVKQELEGAKAYFAYKERCIFCDILHEEEKAAKRVIAQTEHFLAFSPFAPRVPFEFWVVPRRHSCDFLDMGPAELVDLASLMPQLLKKLKRALNDPPYTYYIHTAPNRVPRRNHWHTLGDDYHWHIEVLPKLSEGPSAIDWGSGFFILTTSPEDAAKFIKEA